MRKKKYIIFDKPAVAAPTPWQAAEWVTVRGSQTEWKCRGYFNYTDCYYDAFYIAGGLGLGYCYSVSAATFVSSRNTIYECVRECERACMCVCPQPRHTCPQ